MIGVYHYTCFGMSEAEASSHWKEPSRGSGASCLGTRSHSLWKEAEEGTSHCPLTHLLCWCLWAGFMLTLDFRLDLEVGGFQKKTPEAGSGY
jgi:hypothetical protein